MSKPKKGAGKSNGDGKGDGSGNASGRASGRAKSNGADEKEVYGWLLILRGLESAAIRLGDNPAALRVLCVATAYMNQNGACRFGQGTIAARLNITRQAVNKHLRMLEDMGILFGEAGGTGVTLGYTLNTLELEKKRAGQERVDKRNDRADAKRRAAAKARAAEEKAAKAKAAEEGDESKTKAKAEVAARLRAAGERKAAAMAAEEALRAAEAEAARVKAAEAEAEAGEARAAKLAQEKAAQAELERQRAAAEERRKAELERQRAEKERHKAWLDRPLAVGDRLYSPGRRPHTVTAIDEKTFTVLGDGQDAPQSVPMSNLAWAKRARVAQMPPDWVNHAYADHESPEIAPAPVPPAPATAAESDFG